MFSTALINPALLLNFLFKISMYLLLPLKWCVHDTCIPPPSHFLASGYLLQTPNKLNCFRFPLKFRVIRSRLYVHVNETTALELLAKWPKQKIQCTVLIWVEGLFQCHIAAEHIKVAFTLRLCSQFQRYVIASF